MLLHNHCEQKKKLLHNFNKYWEPKKLSYWEIKYFHFWKRKKLLIGKQNIFVSGREKNYLLVEKLFILIQNYFLYLSITNIIIEGASIYIKIQIY